MDTSGSMAGIKLEAAKSAASAPIDEIRNGIYFAVVAGTHQACLAFPAGLHGAGMVRMHPSTRLAAHQSISLFDSGEWHCAGRLADLRRAAVRLDPDADSKHAILLTDGQNEHETDEQLATAIAAATGKFQCDCRGVAVDWSVDEVRPIAEAVLGTFERIPHTAEMSQEFAVMMQRAMFRGVADAPLRVWAPQGSQVVFVKQVKLLSLI